MTKPTQREFDQRLAYMCTLRNNGYTAKQVGDFYGLTESYVRKATNAVKNEYLESVRFCEREEEALWLW